MSEGPVKCLEWRVHPGVRVGRFTHTLPCPCRFPAILCCWRFKMCLSRLIYTVRPCLIHTCHAMPMPRPSNALTKSFFSMSRHVTSVKRRPVGYLPAFGFFRLPHGVPRRLLSETYQWRWPVWNQTTFFMDEEKSGSSKLQKRRFVKLLE